MSSPHASGSRRTLLLALITALVCAAAPAAAPANTFLGEDFFSVPDSGDMGIADPYPGIIEVAGLGGNPRDVNVAINGFDHQKPDDVDILLVGPGGQQALVMSDVGGSAGMSEPVDLVFDDEASTSLTASSALASGDYKPSNTGPLADSFPSAPPGSRPASFAGFESGPANGQWQLYIVDDGNTADTSGFIESWSLTIGTALQEQQFGSGAEPIGRAIVRDPSTFVSAAFLPGDQAPESTPNAFAAPLAPVLFDNGTASLAGFPGGNGDFGILTSGDATLADNVPQDQSESDGTDNQGTGGGRGDTAFDVSTLRVDVNVPAGASCLSLDYRFLSEEFPEFVGSDFNDAFIAEVDATTWSANGAVVTAPNDFATDTGGEGVNVNGVGPVAVNAAEASDTTYDAATGLVTTKTPITPGNHAIYLSIFDQSDNIYDSAVFLDNLRFFAEDAATCRPPFVTETAPPPPPPPGPDPGPPANTTQAQQTPSNAFTIGSKIVFKNGVTVLTVEVPGPGVLAVTPAGAKASAATAALAKKKKKKKAALVKSARKVVTKAGKVKIAVRPSKAGKKVLRKKGKLRAKVRVSFTPTGGTKKSTVRTITIKRKKKG